jgi:hypothetical protein
MEMNTRLQVEHCVSEMRSGSISCASRSSVAAGHRCRLHAGRRELRGHAIECRINAEDPSDGFRPAPGSITRWQVPDGRRQHARRHPRAQSGYTVPPHYDSLLCKVIAHGATIATPPLDRMIAALEGCAARACADHRAHAPGDPSLRRRFATTTTTPGPSPGGRPPDAPESYAWPRPARSHRLKPARRVWTTHLRASIAEPSTAARALRERRAEVHAAGAKVRRPRARQGQAHRPRAPRAAARPGHPGSSRSAPSSTTASSSAKRPDLARRRGRDRVRPRRGPVVHGHRQRQHRGLGRLVAAHAREDRARPEMALRLRLPTHLPGRLLAAVPARAVALVSRARRAPGTSSR